MQDFYEVVFEVDDEPLPTDKAELIMWHVEKVCGELSREDCVVKGDNDYAILLSNIRAILK